MNRKSMIKTFSIVTATCLLSATLAFGELATPKQMALEREGIGLIAQIEDVSRDVRFNADQLASLNQSPRVSKWSHHHHLAQIKELVNEGLRPALDRLTEIQSSLPDWHQDTIDQMLASAKLLAGDTNSAILSHNEKGSMPPAFNQQYKDLIATINNHAEKLVKISDAAGDYAAAREQAQQAGLKPPTQ